MPNGHASHETGIDVDIWDNLDPKPALAPADREVLQLTLVDGLHPREIAQRLSLSSDTVRQRKTRALKRLMAAVDAGGGEAR